MKLKFIPIFILSVFLIIFPSRGLSETGSIRQDTVNSPTLAKSISWDDLLNEADKILFDPEFAQQFKNNYRSEALYAKLAILQYSQSPDKSLKDAMALSEDFYRSLVLGGTAAIEQGKNLQEAEKLYIEALNRALKIDHWTGSDASSMGYLFQLIPHFHGEQIERLLDLSWKIFDNWDDSTVRKSRAMLILSGITTEVKPSLAEEILRTKILNVSHYRDSLELLAKFLYKSASHETLKLAEECYGASYFRCGDYLRTVLIEHAVNNFNDSFARVKKMREVDQIIACMELAKKLIEVDQKKKAITVLNHLDAFVKLSISRPDNAVHVQAQELSIKLRREMHESKDNIDKSDVDAHEMIDEFLNQPDRAHFDEIVKSYNANNRIRFRDKQHAEKFILQALPFTKEIIDMGYPHHGSPRSTALGTLAFVAAKIKSAEQVMRITNEISIPELRAFYLMESYSVNNPLPEVLNEWPLNFWHHKLTIEFQNLEQ